MKSIDPKEVRYIKLGAGGRWEQRALKRGEMYFGTIDPQSLVEKQDWDAIADHFRKLGYAAGTATHIARENRDFETLGSECLWITFAEGFLWWGFAEPKVKFQGGDGSAHGVRMRKIIGGWRNTDIRGTPLTKVDLSTRLTQVASYRHTMCSVREAAYLIRKLNAQPEEIVARAARARDDMIAVAAEAIAMLHWADFESLIDMIFARAGWQRVSRLGGAQKDIDLEVEQPTTRERAFIQVKSRANQAALEGSISAFETGPWQRMFFACHSPEGPLRTGGRKDVTIWTGKRLADAVVRAGLYDWLLHKAA
jgi:hypothetical protein